MIPTDDQIDAAARALLEAEVGRVRIPALDPAHRPATVADGYRVQARGHELRGRGRGDDVRGPWKVGATSLVAQAALAVDGPFLGRPAPDRVVDDGAELVLDEWFVGPPVLEVEIGLRPIADLRDLPDDPLDLADRVEVAPCVELVNARYEDMGVVGAPSLVADNAVASAIVAGPALDLDLAAIRGLDTLLVELVVDGAVIATGTGADALGHPLAVLHFAAGVALAHGQVIRAGELVITGTCTGVVDGLAGTDVVGRHGGATVSLGLR